MGLGKTIRIYLTDGSPSGPMVAEIINWTGQAVVVPRAQLHELTKREELQRTGIYILVGPDAKGIGDQVYVGEADEIFARLKEHDRDEKKEFWTRAITLTSKDQNLTKAHARYLENRVIRLVEDAGRVVLANDNAPGEKKLPEPDVADMEYFLDQVKLILPVLGFDFLRPPATKDPTANASADKSPKLVMNEVGISASAYEVDGRFVVIKGSLARRQGVPAWDSYITLRDSLVQQKKLIPKDDKLFEFVEDVEFSSPSAAATVVVAGNRNGRTSWKVESTGQTYAEWKENQVAAAER